METEIGTDIAKAKEILERGGLVAIPTETVYGLAANALDPLAVAIQRHPANMGCTPNTIHFFQLPE